MNFSISTVSRPGYASLGPVVYSGTRVEADAYANLVELLDRVDVSVSAANAAPTEVLDESIRLAQCDAADPVADGIIEAIVFTGEELSGRDFSPEALAAIKQYALDFIVALGAKHVKRIADYDTLTCLGNDIWYTTQGCGTGFWEGASRYDGAHEWADQYCKSNLLGEAYSLDDGLIYLM